MTHSELFKPSKGRPSGATGLVVSNICVLLSSTSCYATSGRPNMLRPRSRRKEEAQARWGMILSSWKSTSPADRDTFIVIIVELVGASVDGKRIGLWEIDPK